jgi:alkylhydroperoxidase family enzyme
MEPGDLDSLRVTGLSDAEILDVCQVTAYYNYVNRLADGLGVELEPYWQDSP